MADVELLPLVGTLRALPEHVQGVVQDYARANVEHATALLQAEVEARRAELDVWEGLHASEVQARQRWQARAVELEEALRELVAVFSESGMYDEEVFAKARTALGQQQG